MSRLVSAGDSTCTHGLGYAWAWDDPLPGDAGGLTVDGCQPCALADFRATRTREALAFWSERAAAWQQAFQQLARIAVQAADNITTAFNSLGFDWRDLKRFQRRQEVADRRIRQQLAVRDRRRARRHRRVARA